MIRPVVKFALPVLILAAGAGGMAVLVKSKPAREALDAQERAWPVAVVEIRPETVTPQLALFARVESPRTAHLSAAVTADVLAVDVLEGEGAGPDDRLVVLDDRDLRLVLAQRDAELAGLEADLERETLRHRSNLVALEHEQELLELAGREVTRARGLAERNAGSKASLDRTRRDEEQQMLAVERRTLAIREHAGRRKQVEARIAHARASQSRATLDLERTRVYPPFEGRIAEVLVSPGDRVRPGDRLVTMFDTATLELRAQIPLRYLPVVESALDRGEVLGARAVVDAIAVRAVLHRLTAQIGRGSGGADALFRITDGDTRLQLGRTVELMLDLPPVHDAVAAPRGALYGTDRVFVLDGGRMKRVEVERLGETHPDDRDGRVILRSPDLEATDRLIVTHLPNAIAGLKVVVAGSSPDQPSDRPPDPPTQ